MLQIRKFKKNKPRMPTCNKTSYENNKNEKIISALITLFISGIILFLILTFHTTFFTTTPTTYIDINFDSDLGSDYGTSAVGLGDEEPADQDLQKGNGGDPLGKDGALASSNEIEKEENSYLTNTSSKETVTSTSNTKKSSKDNTKQNSAEKYNTKSKSSKGTGNGKESGNIKGTEAIGALLKGKGNSNSSTGHGSNGKPGQNQGDPMGNGSGGGEGFGNGRNLIGFIPGTMGRGGSVPPYNCSGTGTIIFNFTVDKTGNVTSVNRKSGISNTCLVNTGIKWIKQYVKADKGKSPATGTYRINFN
ncbi:hypothetical protein C4S76_11155 [Apibacter adventoris]|nr:hypothetical protein C4S76_11155 [Apibacter adventoris]